MLVTIITKSNNICFVQYYNTLLRGKTNLFELGTKPHFNHELQVHTESKMAAYRSKATTCGWQPALLLTVG